MKMTDILPLEAYPFTFRCTNILGYCNNHEKNPRTRNNDNINKVAEKHENDFVNHYAPNYMLASQGGSFLNASVRKGE